MPSISNQALQKHVRYFDENGDGKIYPGEMYRKARELGMSSGRAALFTALTEVTRGTPTSGKPWVVDLNNIEKSRFDGSSGVVDAQGDITGARVNEFFSTTDTNHDGKLQESELMARVDKDNPSSWWAQTKNKAGWSAVVRMAGKVDASGERSVTKSQVDDLYSGDLFFKLAAENKANGQK